MYLIYLKAQQCYHYFLLPINQSCLDQLRKFEAGSEVTSKFEVVGDVQNRGIRDVACSTVNIFNGCSSGLPVVYLWSTSGLLVVE